MVYPCADTGKDSSALILLFLDLSAFPKYVALRSEFSSNLIVLNILTVYLHTHLNIPPLICLAFD